MSSSIFSFNLGESHHDADIPIFRQPVQQMSNATAIVMMVMFFIIMVVAIMYGQPNKSPGTVPKNSL